jgi:hypothetical protein
LTEKKELAKAIAGIPQTEKPTSKITASPKELARTK